MAGQFLYWFYVIFSADEIPVYCLENGRELSTKFLEENGFDIPIVVDKKDGLGMTVPPANFSIQDVENVVGKWSLQ